MILKFPGILNSDKMRACFEKTEKSFILLSAKHFIFSARHHIFCFFEKKMYV